jgi:transposase
VRNHSANANSRTIGVDLGDRWSQVCVLDADGDIEEESRVRTRPEALRQRFSSCSRSRVAIEVGTHSPWVSSLLVECGHEVLVANARRVRAIYQNDTKCDRTDAQMLARLARSDPRLLHPVRHRGEQARRDLELLRARDTLVRSRTQEINHVRGSLKSFGVSIPRCSAEAFVKRLDTVEESLRSLVAPIVEMIRTLTTAIKDYERRIEAMATRYPEVQLLRQISGVGPMTATAYVLTIEDPHRFSRSRAVGSYLGLRSARSQSGDSDPQRRITRAGDAMVRRLLVTSAQYILGPFGPDTDLRRKGLEIAARGGKNAKKRAVVAVARRLSVLLHRLWITGEVYEPLRIATMRGAATAA